MFQAHAITAEEIPHLKDEHLKEMGISSVGDRLKILDAVSYYLRGVRNAKRHEPLLKFKGWVLFPCFDFFATEYTISEAAIQIRDPQPLLCRTIIDNVDVTSIIDVKVSEWLGTLGYITVLTTDVTSPTIKIRLSVANSRKVFGLIRRVWEADQLKMGKCFISSLLFIYLLINRKKLTHSKKIKQIGRKGADV